MKTIEGWLYMTNFKELSCGIETFYGECFTFTFDRNLVEWIDDGVLKIVRVKYDSNNRITSFNKMCNFKVHKLGAEENFFVTKVLVVNEEITVGQAAAICGISKYDCMKKLSEAKVPVFGEDEFDELGRLKEEWI